MNERRLDFERLQRFARQADQSAFADVVRRHLDLVFATALRKTGDHGAAQEIAQNVFAALARKAWQFAPDDSLPAWLHKTALFQSNTWLRGELGRRRREQTAAELATTMNTPEHPSAFQELVPLLDDAMLSLREKDRTALLLRFCENQSLREVGEAFGITDDTAQKRVQSALEKVTDFFKRRGFKTVSVALAAAALEHTATTASAAVVDAVVSAALKAAPPVLAGFKLLLAQLAILTRPQKTAVCATLVVCMGLFFVRSCEAGNRPSVAIERAGTNMTVRFTGALQRANQPQGPFRPVPGARSPWVVPAGAGQEFWRAWWPGVSTIAAGHLHTVALRTDGTLWSWGNNLYGGLGIGTFDTNDPYGRNTPQRVGNDTNWLTVAAGDFHTVALRSDGTLWAWGWNERGQLGIGTFNTSPPYGTNSPQRVGNDTNWQSVAAATYHTMALRTDGMLWAWGYNYYGQLGIGTFNTSPPYGTNSPQQVGTDTNWQSVAVGVFYTVALRMDGTLWAWGRNDDGQLGDGTYTSANTPQQIGTNANWQAIAPAKFHTAALRTDGTLWAWGRNNDGQLGIGTYETNAPYGTNTPQQIGSDTNWQAVTTGYSHTLALRTDGTLWAWGRLASNLGDTTLSTYGPTPSQIGTNANWKAVSTFYHAVALRGDGTLWTWGNNDHGQLGVGTFNTNAPYGTTTPQQVGTNTNWGPPP